MIVLSRGSRLTLASFLFASGCGAASSTAPEPSRVVVPAQPPQPAASRPHTLPPEANGVAAAPVPFRCEGGMRFEIAGRPHCAYADPQPWLAAEERCVAGGGHLVTLDTRAKSNALRGALGSPIMHVRAVWMGLEKTKVGKGQDWRWITGEIAKVTSWDDGEPNDFDGSEACGEWLVASGLWNDTRCDLRLPALCQGKMACKDGVSFVVGSTPYCLGPRSESFADAKHRCAQNGGALATPKTEAANTALRDALGARFSATRMWIGLTDAEDEGAWVWSSGTRMAFEAWQPGEPNDYRGEDCVELAADAWDWNDRDCGDELPSVCEGPAPVRP